MRVTSAGGAAAGTGAAAVSAGSGASRGDSGGAAAGATASVAGGGPASIGLLAAAEQRDHADEQQQADERQQERRRRPPPAAPTGLGRRRVGAGGDDDRLDRLATRRLGRRRFRRRGWRGGRFARCRLRLELRRRLGEAGRGVDLGTPPRRALGRTWAGVAATARAGGFAAVSAASIAAAKPLPEAGRRLGSAKSRTSLASGPGRASPVLWPAPCISATNRAARSARSVVGVASSSPCASRSTAALARSISRAVPVCRSISTVAGRTSPWARLRAWTRSRARGDLRGPAGERVEGGPGRRLEPPLQALPVDPLDDEGERVVDALDREQGHEVGVPDVASRRRVGAAARGRRRRRARLLASPSRRSVEQRPEGAPRRCETRGCRPRAHRSRSGSDLAPSLSSVPALRQRGRTRASRARAASPAPPLAGVGASMTKNVVVRLRRHDRT